MSAPGERDRLAVDLLYAAWAVVKNPNLRLLVEEAIEEASPDFFATAREDLPIEASREEIGEWLLAGLGSVPC